MSRAIAQRWTGTRALAAWIACLSSLSLGQSALAQVPLNGACLGDSCPTPAGVTTRVRTWVSGVGDDANTCGRVDPSKTLAAALSMTIGGGEVDILDPGDFGSAIITSSVTIDGRGGGRAALGGAGTSSIVGNAGPPDVVILRNLSRNSEQGLVLPPITNGITFVSGRALVVENSIIRGFAGRGIDFEPATGGRLFLRNVVTRDNGRAGVYVASTSPSQAFATIVKLRSSKNWNGLRVAGNARMSLYRSTASQITDAGLLVAVTDTSAGEMNAEEMVVTENAVGVRAETSNGTAF